MWKRSGVVSRFVRRVRTASGAVAVQIVTRRGRQIEEVEHLGSARTDADLALLLATARDRLAPGQDELDLGVLPAVAPRLDDIADWTSERRARGQQDFLTGGNVTGTGATGTVSGADSGADAVAVAAGPASTRQRGRPAKVNVGGRVVATSSLLLWQVLTDAYSRLGFDALGDEAFRAMVLARIVEPTSKADSLRSSRPSASPAPRPSRSTANG